MDFSRKPKSVKKEVDELAEQFPHVLCLYKHPPTCEIELSEFEDLAYDRVQVLRLIEQASQMGNKLYSAEWRIAVLGSLRKQNLRRYIRLLESTGCSAADADPQIRREDYLSHFILRLAYCRSLDLRNWFIARETELFKMRFLNLSTEGLKKFIQCNDLKYFPITQEEKEEIKDCLCKSTVGYSPVQVETTDFYKVPFTEVLDLVRNASVYLHKGYAYIPTSELVSCMISWLRNHLQQNLMESSQALPRLDDERISSLLATLHASYVGKDFSSTVTNKGLTAENIQLIRKSFPMCMRTLNDIIKSTHHMKHFGRLQFGLFLKGIGLSLEEAIKYWRTEFTKGMDEETFNKKYLYSIKHSYGTIGRMLSYTPYGCKKIISSEPGASEQHGCPFRLWDSENLKQKIMEFGVSTAGAKEVVEIASKGHYQIACSKYFMYTHGGTESKQIVIHPNQYFEESQEITNPKSTESAASSSTNKRKLPESYTPSTQNSTKTELDESVFDDGFDISQLDETMDF